MPHAPRAGPARMTVSQVPAHRGRTHMTQDSFQRWPANEHHHQLDTRDYVRVWLISDENHWVPVLALDDKDRNV